jgi:hypothetical protein
MAGGALSVTGELRENTLRVECMTESAVRPEAADWILPALFIDVIGV